MKLVVKLVKGSLAAFGLLVAALIVVPLFLESSPEIAARPEGAGSRVSSEQAIAACRLKAETWLPRYFKQDHDCPDCGVSVRFRGDGSSVDPWEGGRNCSRARRLGGQGWQGNDLRISLQCHSDGDLVSQCNEKS